MVGIIHSGWLAGVSRGTIEAKLTKAANFNPEFFPTSQEFEILHTGFFKPN